MRHIAQKSIGNLHETSDTTMLQISDILNNLEHGLFSINLDGPINDDGKIALLFESHLSTSKSLNEVSGRGLGMDIIKQCIEVLGGTITTNSIFGQETTFCIKVPLNSLV